MSRGSGYAQPSNWASLRNRVLNRDSHSCYICGGPAISVDHILAVARGGTHKEKNLGSICAPCKAAKDEADRLAGIEARKARTIAYDLSESHPNARR